jgi:hypothetical protein
MKIPSKFESILKQNEELHSLTLEIIVSFQPIYRDNKLFFFEEYTDHGIQHIENVLSSAEHLITEGSFEYLTSKDVAIFILAVVLHDIGMHCEYSTFVSLLNGEYDKFRAAQLDEKTWMELWIEYLSEVKRLSSQQKKNIFGNEFQQYSAPNLLNKDSLSGYDKKLIGEFIRRYHPRLSHEMALNGLVGSKNQKIKFGSENLSPLYRKLIGIVARSHGMNLRDTFKYLEEIAGQGWRNPDDINIVFLMILLRISDYIQIDKSRVNSILLKVKTFNSPISAIEHATHLAIESVSFNQPDNEKIFVSCTPTNSEMLVKLKTLFFDIQRELDTSWAIIGEVYGFLNSKIGKLKYRRITSNLEDTAFLNRLNYFPQRIKFEVNNELSKLLVGPLYGNNPTFGVRELVQNAVDACIERNYIETQNSAIAYIPKITVSINEVGKDNYIFEISDNGKGMSIDEIIHYFLNVGSSFRKSLLWKKQFINEEGHTLINRNGKFGIGVLAAFLIGEELTVTTRHFNETISYSFTTNIDSDFIDIKREITTTKKIGTTISLLISKERKEELLQENKRQHERDKIWTDWYVNDFPKVEYFVNGEKIERTILFDKDNISLFQTEDFKKIEWKYFGSYRYGSLAISDTCAVCNGIVISTGLHPAKNKFIYNKNRNDSFVIEKKPSFFFEDSEGVFPIKLDRNDIDCTELPFEKELLSEVSKDFIAQILTLKVDIGKRLHNIEIENTNAEVLFHKNGFLLNFDYFINKVIEGNLSLIRLITSQASVPSIYLINSDYIITLKTEEKINLTYQEVNVAPICSGRILLKTKAYTDLFKSSVKRLPVFVKNNHSLVVGNERFVIYDFMQYKTKSSIFQNMNFINNLELDNMESIQELELSYFKLKGGDILNALLSDYIGNNYIIPYDMKKRAKLFKKAFSELSPYIKKHV